MPPLCLNPIEKGTITIKNEGGGEDYQPKLEQERQKMIKYSSKHNEQELTDHQV